jgi:hypothetical protein
MPVSPKKRAANQRNALKSTGPKSQKGRSVSAANAIRHGLSVPLSPQLIEPLHQELAQLVALEEMSQDAARDIALKIIEYERNVLYLKENFKKQMLGCTGGDQADGLSESACESDEMGFEDFLSSFKEINLQGLGAEERRQMDALRDMCAFIVKVEKQNQPDSPRYFKRSANQLIKALRRL